MRDGALAGECAQPRIGAVCLKPLLKRPERGTVRVGDAELENQGDRAGDEIRRGVIGGHGQCESQQRARSGCTDAQEGERAKHREPPRLAPSAGRGCMDRPMKMVDPQVATMTTVS